MLRNPIARELATALAAGTIAAAALGALLQPFGRTAGGPAFVAVAYQTDGRHVVDFNLTAADCAPYRAAGLSCELESGRD